MGLQTNSRLAAHYHLMRRIRTFEERVGELFVRGQSAGSMLHLSIGEEAAAVGVGSNMRDGDTFTTHHREPWQTSPSGMPNHVRLHTRTISNIFLGYV